jgi:hypothetical protein
MLSYKYVFLMMVLQSSPSGVFWTHFLSGTNTYTVTVIASGAGWNLPFNTTIDFCFSDLKMKSSSIIDRWFLQESGTGHKLDGHLGVGPNVAWED